MIEKENEKHDKIVQTIKDVHEKIKNQPVDIGKKKSGTAASDLAAQLKGSDGDVDRSVENNPGNTESPDEQLKGSDADQDKA